MLGSQESEPMVSLESIMDYISEVDKHFNELF